jgi:hypothetical protein
MAPSNGETTSMATSSHATITPEEQSMPQQKARVGPSAGPPARRPTTGTPSARRRIIDVEAALQEQLQDDRYIEMRADMGAQYVENLQIPNYGDLWIPGYRVITEALAKEYGLQAAYEDDPFSELPLDEPQPESGAVDGNLIVSFVDGVTGQQKNDVLNCCLLAQLAANFRFNREENPVPWTRFYGSVLENVGWVVPQFQFRRLQSNQARFTMDAAILRFLTDLLTQNEKDTVQAAIDAVKALQDGDRRLRIFERNSVEEKVGNFQVDSVGVSATGVLSMKIGAFGFKTSERVTKVLWFSFGGASTSMEVTKTTLVLNEQVHERLRDAILNKLGSRGLEYIGGLPLAD